MDVRHQLFENGWIDHGELMTSADAQAKSEYGKYLRDLAARAGG